MFIFLIMGVIMAAGIFIILNSMGSKRVRQARQTRMYRNIYRRLSKFFLTQGYLAQVYSRLANLSIYRREELQVLSAKYLIFAWGSGLALAVSSFFMFHDFLTVLICILFAVLLATVVVEKQLDSMHYKVLRALAQLISSIRQEYMRTNDVVESLQSADCPPLLKKPVEEMIQILTQPNGELRLQEFCVATPFRTIQTLAGICYHINNEGDDIDAYGQSNFNQALTLMSGDVNSERQKILYRKKRFGIIEYLPFVPIFGMSLLETYFVSIMPGTALIYNGPLGYLCRTITVVTAIIAYVVVSRINTTTPIKDDDRGDWVLNLLEKPFIRRMIHNITPKNKKGDKVRKSLKDSLSKMTLDQLYLKKVGFAVVAFALACLCATSTLSLGRDFIEHSTQQLSLVATGEMSKYETAAIENLDKTYLASPNAYSDSQIEGMVRKAMPGLSDLQIQDQVKRLKDKNSSLQNAYFKWWYVWICVGVSYLGWFAPNLTLKVRKMLVQTEEEDDFLQLQTLASILMNTNMDTLDLLRQFAQQSRVHKHMFMYAHQGYPSNPQLELARLASKTPLIEFKYFIKKMELTISDLSLKEAYSDLLIERSHILREREMTIKSSIDRKRGLCGPLSMVPLAAMIIGEFLLPIGILGFNEFMNALNSM
jgi:hypothetical protein